MAQNSNVLKSGDKTANINRYKNFSLDIMLTVNGDRSKTAKKTSKVCYS